MCDKTGLTSIGFLGIDVGISYAILPCKHVCSFPSMLAQILSSRPVGIIRGPANAGTSCVAVLYCSCKQAACGFLRPHTRDLRLCNQTADMGTDVSKSIYADTKRAEG